MLILERLIFLDPLEKVFFFTFDDTRLRLPVLLALVDLLLAVVMRIAWLLDVMLELNARGNLGYLLMILAHKAMDYLGWRPDLSVSRMRIPTMFGHPSRLSHHIRSM